jgi:Carboxypeptidase regulatory-like domain
MRRSGWLAGIVFAVGAAGLVPQGPAGALAPCALAQSTGMRTVSGAVLNGSSAAVADATVFLQDQKTKTIRSYTTLQDGHFYFAQVNMADSYNLWAEKNKQKSATKIVSSWDTRTAYITNLKLK